MVGLVAPVRRGAQQNPIPVVIVQERLLIAHVDLIRNVRVRAAPMFVPLIAVGRAVLSFLVDVARDLAAIVQSVSGSTQTTHAMAQNPAHALEGAVHAQHA